MVNRRLEDGPGHAEGRRTVLYRGICRRIHPGNHSYLVGGPEIYYAMGRIDGSASHGADKFSCGALGCSAPIYAIQRAQKVRGWIRGSHLHACG